VERLLAGPLFSQSKRYGVFLRYVTERALHDTREPLTERSLGVEIFGRPLNYDTEADPIVRVTASELRKRLAHYYADPAHAGEIRVVIHKGTYQAEFIAPGDSQSLLPATAQVNAPVAKPHKHTWFLAAVLTGFCALAVVLAWLVAPKPTVSELFWKPVFNGPQDVLLSVPQFSDHVTLAGVDDPQLTWTDPLTPVPDPMDVSWAQYARRLVHISDLSVACRLSEFLGSKGKRVLIKGEHDLTLRDLREIPAVILGGLNNQWTARLLPQARFSFAGEGAVRYIRDSHKPDSRAWNLDSRVRSGSREKDLIIISRVADSLSGRVTVLVGGFSAWGTEAAVELITDANQMQRVLANAPCNWGARNLQVALECTVVNRESGVPRFLAAHYW